MAKSFFDDMMTEFGGDMLPISVRKEDGRIIMVIRLPRYGSPLQTVPSFNQKRKNWDNAIKRILRTIDCSSLEVEVRYETRNIHLDEIATELYTVIQLPKSGSMP